MYTKDAIFMKSRAEPDIHAGDGKFLRCRGNMNSLFDMHRNTVTKGIYSFNYSVSHSVNQSSIQSFIHSIIHSFIHSFITEQVHRQ